MLASYMQFKNNYLLKKYSKANKEIETRPRIFNN